MANNLIRRLNNRELSNGGTWDPFQVMRDMLRWDPFREESGLPQALRASYTPSFDVRETKDAFHFHADLPGLKEKDLDITFNGNQLTIAGRREEEKRDDAERYHTVERWYGSFARTFSLPEGVDAENVTAELKDGVLRVVVPKRPEVQPRKISVSVGADKKASA